MKTCRRSRTLSGDPVVLCGRPYFPKLPLVPFDWMILPIWLAHRSNLNVARGLNQSFAPATLLTVKVNLIETGSKKTSCIWKNLFNTPPQSFKMSQDCRHIMTAESRKPAAYDAPCADGAV